MKKFTAYILFLLLSLFGLGTPHHVFAQTPIPWPMAGANPQRTNWTSSNIDPGALDNATLWVKPIYPHVQQKIQVVAAQVNDRKLVFVSTASGLYAFNADTGADVWQYPTALPLGHSPTYANGFLYVGGLDKKIHKVNAYTGAGVWTYTAEGGFDSNPIVVNGRIYATNRDGALYAISDVNPPTLAWKFQTGNQISQSPAYKPEDDGIPTTTQGTLYFASNDGYAYGVDAATGNPVWGTDGKSDADPATTSKDKFPSKGFYTWWPVIFREDVIFMRSGFFASNGAEANWLFCATGSSCPSLNRYVTAGRVYCEQSGTLYTPGPTTPDPCPTEAKLLDITQPSPDRTGDGIPDGRTYPDYFEAHPLPSPPGSNYTIHGPQQRNAFFVNRATGRERQFDLDQDGNIDAAPVAWEGDSHTHGPAIVVGNATPGDDDDDLYFKSINRAGSYSFSNANINGWEPGSRYLKLPASYYRSSDEPTGFSASGIGTGARIFYNHCCDRGVTAIDISRPNFTYPNDDRSREFGYIGGGGLPHYNWVEAGGTNGLPIHPTEAVGTPGFGYYFKETSKFFWDPQILDPARIAGADPTMPCCPGVFWNENVKVGPAAFDGKLFVMLGNALIAIGPDRTPGVDILPPSTGPGDPDGDGLDDDTGKNAPVLVSAPNVTPTPIQSSITESQLISRLNQEVQKMIDTDQDNNGQPDHLKPSLGVDNGHWSDGYEDNMSDYWHNPADLHLVLLRALPYLNSSLQTQVRAYLQRENTLFPLYSYSHIGFISGTPRDLYPYPPDDPNTFTHLFTVNSFGPRLGPPFYGWGMNVYAMWKYAEAGIGCPTPPISTCNPQTISNSLLNSFGNNFRAPITANNSSLTDAKLTEFPHVLNAYIAGYTGYVELSKLAGRAQSLYSAHEAELTRLKNLKVQIIKPFPDPKNFGICDIECYFESHMTYFGFAHMTKELGEHLRTYARTAANDPTCDLSLIPPTPMSNCRDALKILEKYLLMEPMWMMAHNGETQGEYAVVPYLHTHTLFQALSLVKGATRSELLKYLDAPIVSVGDLYYIDNLVAVLEATDTPGASPSPVNCTPAGDTNCNGRVNMLDAVYLILNWGTTNFTANINGQGTVDGEDMRLLFTNMYIPPFILPSPTPTPTLQPTPTLVPTPK